MSMFEEPKFSSEGPDSDDAFEEDFEPGDAGESGDVAGEAFDDVQAGADEADGLDEEAPDVAGADEDNELGQVNRLRGGAAKAVLEHVTRMLVDDPESVVVDVSEGRSGLRFSVHVAQSDMGRIIGRRGRTAQAIRTLVRAAAASEGVEASVDIVD